MKSALTFFLLLCVTLALAQPPNDECGGATRLTLGTPTACPNSTPVTNTFNVTNINATPTTPYPTFSHWQCLGNAGDQRLEPGNFTLSRKIPVEQFGNEKLCAVDRCVVAATRAGNGFAKLTIGAFVKVSAFVTAKNCHGWE